MNTSQFSLELGSSNDGGANLVAGPLTRAIVVNGYQVNASIGFPAFTPTNVPVFAEALSMGFFTLHAPVFSGGLQQGGGNLSVNNDWTNSSVSSPDAWVTAQGLLVPSDGILFSRITKTMAPAAASFDIAMSGLSLPIPAGAYLVIHVDIGMAQPMPLIDVELQGVLFYTRQ